MIDPHEWMLIRQEYESGDASLSALERHYGVSRQAIRKRAAKEQWVTPERLQGPVTGNSHGVITRDVNAGMRVAEAIKYRQAGWTYERIAAACSYANPGSARNAVQRELDRILTQQVEEWRTDHLARLEKLHEEIWTLTMDRKAKGRLFALDRTLAILEREAKLLGLDKKSDEEAQGAQVIIQEVPAGLLEGPKL